MMTKFEDLSMLRAALKGRSLSLTVTIQDRGERLKEQARLRAFLPATHREAIERAGLTLLAGGLWGHGISTI